jgi:hypothetical protein
VEAARPDPLSLMPRPPVRPSPPGRRCVRVMAA